MNARRKLKLGVLISGRGTNLQALIDAQTSPNFPAEITLVLSNAPGAEGLGRCARANIPTHVIDHKDFDGREAFEDALHHALASAGAQLVCLAGFMRLLTDNFVARWRDRLGADGRLRTPQDRRI